MHPQALIPSSVLMAETQLDSPHTQNKSRRGMLSFLALRMGFSPHTLHWSRPVSEQWSVPCTRLHSEEAEADRASSVTTSRSLCSWVSFGTCAQDSGKSRWHVGGRVQPHKLPVLTRSTYHLHFDVTVSGGAQEEAGRISCWAGQCSALSHQNLNMIVSQIWAPCFWL